MAKKSEEDTIEVQKNLVEDEIDLYELFQILWKRKKLIFNITIFLLVSGILITLLIPTSYVVSVNMSIREKILSEAFMLSSDELIFIFGFRKQEIIHTLHTLNEEILVLKDIEIRKTKPPFPNKVLLEIKFSKLPQKEELQKYISTILNSIEKIPEISKIYQQENQELKAQLNFINNNLETYKKISTRIKQNLLEQKNANLGFNLAELDNSILAMENKLTKLKEFVEENSIFEKSETFPYRVSHKPNRLLMITVILITSISIGIFSAFVVEYLQNLRNRKQ